MSNNPQTKYVDNILLQFSYKIVKYTLGILVRVIWIKRVEGLENIPKKGPAIIAFNHQSFFDFLCFTSICPRHIHFLSAEKFFSHILWAPLMFFTSQIKVDRENSNKEELHSYVHSHLDNNKIIGIFPEGTRSPHETEMLYAFTGVAQYAMRGNVPVIPVGIRGTYQVMSKHAKIPKFKKIVTIHIGKRVNLDDHYNSELDKKNYRLITDKIMLKIAELSGKNYSHIGRLE